MLGLFVCFVFLVFFSVVLSPAPYRFSELSWLREAGKQGSLCRGGKIGEEEGLSL